MSLIAVLDEVIVGVEVAFAGYFQTTPLSVLIAIGAVVIGIAVIGRVAVVLLTSAAQRADTARCAAPQQAPVTCADHAEVRASRPRRPAGARGARAPGRSPRPLTHA
ncbi:hypothetical protein [uncultured Microbacterium sp.]|uniref:hypothetical protein n=1 Tax=uncultured Microbacterium sp. TaxID=191216 RepID=UPI0025E676D8|nr:hypothetical protein [uncultured Microbacterium sp.]